MQKRVLHTFCTQTCFSLSGKTGSSVNTESLSTVLLGEEEVACTSRQVSWGRSALESWVSGLELAEVTGSGAEQFGEAGEEACRKILRITGLPQAKSDMRDS